MRVNLDWYIILPFSPGRERGRKKGNREGKGKELWGLSLPHSWWVLKRMLESEEVTLNTSSDGHESYLGSLNILKLLSYMTSTLSRLKNQPDKPLKHVETRSCKLDLKSWGLRVEEGKPLWIVWVQSPQAASMYEEIKVAWSHKSSMECSCRVQVGDLHFTTISVLYIMVVRHWH